MCVLARVGRPVPRIRSSARGTTPVCPRACGSADGPVFPYSCEPNDARTSTDVKASLCALPYSPHISRRHLTLSFHRVCPSSPDSYSWRAGQEFTEYAAGLVQQALLAGGAAAGAAVGAGAGTGAGGAGAAVSGHPGPTPGTAGGSEVLDSALPRARLRAAEAARRPVCLWGARNRWCTGHVPETQATHASDGRVD